MKKILLTCFLVFPVAASLVFSGQTIVLKVKVQLANARTSPDFNSAIVKQIAVGTLLEAKAKRGDWYEISVEDNAGKIVTAYIHSMTVDVVSGEAAQPAGKQPQAAQPPAARAEKEIEPSPEEAPESSRLGAIPSGLFLKFGVIANGWGDWLGSFGFDFKMMKNFSLGAELMPSYYSVAADSVQMKGSTIPVDAFLNFKGGTNLSMILPKLDFVKLYGGLGGGLALAYTTTTIEDASSSLFTYHPAIHIIIGSELQARSIGLIFEYQLIRVMDPKVKPNSWTGYLIFGIRL
jgi:hypothetical protein